MADRTWACRGCGERTNSMAADPVGCWKCGAPRTVVAPLFTVPPTVPHCASCGIAHDPYQDIPDTCRACGLPQDVAGAAR